MRVERELLAHSVISRLLFSCRIAEATCFFLLAELTKRNESRKLRGPSGPTQSPLFFGPGRAIRRPVSRRSLRVRRRAIAAMAPNQFAQIEAAEAGFNASDADASGLRDQPPRSWKKVVGASAGAIALCAAAGVAAARLGGGATSGASPAAALQQKQQIIAMPGPDMCSDWKDDCRGDCLATGCCEQSGFRCFVTDSPNATVTPRRSVRKVASPATSRPHPSAGCH